MALPPTVPTSFVPHSTTSSLRRPPSDFGGALVFAGFGVLFVACLAAIFVFGYGLFLSNAQLAKEQEIQAARDEIDTATVESFISLANRITEAKKILNEHRAVSKALDLFETIMPTTIQFSSMHVTFSDDEESILSVTGVASSLNALADFSLTLGKEPAIKNAILSGGASEKTTEFAFTLSANLEKSLTSFVTDESSPPVAPQPET